MAKDDLAVRDRTEPPAMIDATAELVAQAYDAIFEGKIPPEVGDPSVTHRAIMERVRDATEFDAVFAPSKLKNWREYEGKPVSVLAFHLNPSDFKEGSPVYAVVEIMHPDTGVIETVQTGGGNVLTQLVKAWEMSWFPVQLKLIVKDGKEGRDVLWLEKP